jgi:hypothetical protein
LIIKKKKSPIKKWFTVVCAIIGVLLIVYAGVDFVRCIFQL